MYFQSSTAIRCTELSLFKISLFTIVFYGVLLIRIHGKSVDECSSLECCTLGREQLLECADISEKCPEYVGIGVLGPDGQCDECPPGQCRVKNSCICPTEFLKSESEGGFQSQCQDHFKHPWPESVREIDYICSEEASNGASPSPHSSSGLSLRPDSMITYIQEQAKQGRNVVGMVATVVIAILILIVCWCSCPRRRRY